MSLPEELRPSLAPPPRRTWRDVLFTWLERHAQTFVASLGRLVRRPFATALTIIVIGIALALPACLYLAVVNAHAVTAGLENSVQVSIYLRQPITLEEARKVTLGIGARRDVLEARLVTPEEGLKEFQALSGFGEALKALKENPLPYAVIVRPKPLFDTPQAVEGLTSELRALHEVELVQVDTEWVRRLEAMLEAFKRIVLLTAGLLGIGVVAIVGNTVRLDINERRDEIEVTKLVGGSDAFVRRPFLYAGLWHGLLGGLVAWGIVALAIAGVAQPVQHLASLYASTFQLSGLRPEAISLLVGGSALFGLLGSWLTAGYHLRRIEPRA